MPKRLYWRAIVTLALMASSTAVALAQWPTGPLRTLLDQTSLQRVIERDAPVTTGLDDALTGIEFLDRFTPSAFMPLGGQPQDAAGAFHVGPGAYDFVAQSYCLHAGTHGPGGGDGYVSAPLKGARSGAVRHILQNAVAHPDIPQQDIQVLLWAILARTRIGDMPRKTQLTAARLLTPAELVDLNGGVFGLISDRPWGEANASFPPALRRAFEQEARFRQMLSAVDSSFDAIERFAVLAGDPAPDAASRKIPEGRWSYHPAGYFIRFFPSGYSRTQLHVYVPEPITLVRDSAGRIQAIGDHQGARVELDYVDAATSGIEASAVRGDGFESIRLVQPDGGRLEFRVDVNGWTAKTASRQAEAWRTLLKQHDVRDLVDLAQLHSGLETASRSAGNSQIARQLSPVLEVVAAAWATTFCAQAGGCAGDTRSAAAAIPLPGMRFTSIAEPGVPAIGPTAPAAGLRGDPRGAPGRRVRTPGSRQPARTVDLAEAVAVPGHRGRQRLGLSGRSQR